MIITIVYGVICLFSETIKWDWKTGWIILLIDYIVWSK